LNIEELYRQKLMSADDAVKLIPDHSTVLTNVAVGHPVALVNALVRRQDSIRDVELFYVVDLYDTDIKNIHPESGLKVDLGYPVIHRRDVQEGKFYHTPVRFCDAAKVFLERKVSTTMHLVAPMDKHGYFCMGVGADYGLSAMRMAEKVLVQVSSTVPRSHGENFVHISQVDAIVEAEQQLFQLPDIPPNANEEIIGRYCAEFVQDGAVEAKFWRRFCERIGRPEYIPYQWDSSRQAEILTDVRAIMAGKTRQEWVDFFAEDDICFTPVLNLQEMTQHPQVKNREMIIKMENVQGSGKDMMLTGSAVKLSHTPAVIEPVFPEIGEHTDALLQEIGYSSREIANLKEKKVLA
jgi:hypothetical protein